MNVNPIGVVKSPVKEGVDNDWGDVISEIYIFKEFTDGLKGIEEFSNIIVIFYMDKSTFDRDRDIRRKPQGRDDMPEVGIFAQRAKHRPNPIGITNVRLLSVNENILKVQGLDAIDKTPILDIKPHFPVYDSCNGAKVPEWVDRLMEGYF